MASVFHIDHTGSIDLLLAARIFLPTQFRIGDHTRDAFGLALAPDIRFELRENGEHPEERLAGRRRCVDRLLQYTQRRCLALDLMRDVREIAQ